MWKRDSKMTAEVTTSFWLQKWKSNWMSTPRTCEWSDMMLNQFLKLLQSRSVTDLCPSCNMLMKIALLKSYGRKWAPNMTKAVEEHIPRKNRIKQPWLKEDTINIAEHRKQAKIKGGNERWSQLNKDFTKVEEADKRKYLNDQCKKLRQIYPQPKRSEQSDKRNHQEMKSTDRSDQQQEWKDPDRDRGDSEEKGWILWRTLYKTTSSRPPMGTNCRAEYRARANTAWSGDSTETHMQQQIIWNRWHCNGNVKSSWRSDTHMEAVC